MIARLLAVCALAAGCGQRPSTPTGDAGTDVSSDTDAGGSDADVMPDALTGVLSPEPADLTSTPCGGRLVFPTLPTVPVVTGRELVLADVDVDGIKDMITLDTSGIRVARGAGNGTFNSPSTFALTGIRDFQIADVDGSGKPDLIYGVLAGGHDVRVALNDGSGGFGTAQSYSTNDTPVDQVEVSDVNGDGTNDLITLSSSGYAISVLLRSGSSFAAPVQYSVGGTQYANQIAVGDLTGDGRPEVVATNGNQGTVSVLVNSGTGTFAPRVAYATPNSPYGVVLADMNEDGKLDVVVATTQAGNATHLSVLLNQGAAVLGTATSFAVGGLFESRSLAAADVNGDGHVDIGVAQLQELRANILFGTGTGQLGSPFSIPNDGPERIAFSDLDGDNHQDVVVLNKFTATPFLNTGAATVFSVRARYDVGTLGTSTRSGRMTDLNSDGRLDLLWIRNDGATTVSARLADTNGGYGSATSVALSFGATGDSRLADVNNDSRADLLLEGFGASGSVVYTVLNNGNGTLSAAPTVVDLPREPVEMLSADIDGNGVRDLVIGDMGPYPAYVSEVRYYPGFANGQFGPGTVIWTGEALNGLAVVDLNGDGTRDVVVASYVNGPRQEVLLGAGNGVFGPPTMVASLLTTRLAARDINADGKIDLIGFMLEAVVTMLGNGDGTFGAPLESPRSASQIIDYAFADFDGDGHIDLVTPYSYAVAILRGDGNGAFQSPLYFEAGAQPTSITLGDVDADGRIDILVNNSREMLSILRGGCL